MSVLGVVFSGAMLAETLRMAVPYVCASTGGVLSERSGVVNIALEGTLLSSALVAVAVEHATGSAMLGVLGGVLGGALVGLTHALLVVHGRIDAIVSGLALNLAAAGGTRFCLRALYGSSSNSPSVPGLRLFAGLPVLARAVLDPFVIAALLAALCAGFLLGRTRFGLHVRAAGEDPAAAAAVGISVARVRVASVTLGGAVCGLGGAALAYDLHQFQAGMTGGRGFIALAAVILSGWSARGAAVLCLAFAALDALQGALQNQTHAPSQLFAVLPYVATLISLALVRRRTSGLAPAGLGKHAEQA